jgi:hypothetical protein
MKFFTRLPILLNNVKECNLDMSMSIRKIKKSAKEYYSNETHETNQPKTRHKNIAVVDCVSANII